jgi:hypothetical protein
MQSSQPIPSIGSLCGFKLRYGAANSRTLIRPKTTQKTHDRCDKAVIKTRRAGFYLSKQRAGVSEYERADETTRADSGPRAFLIGRLKKRYSGDTGLVDVPACVATDSCYRGRAEIAIERDL